MAKTSNTKTTAAETEEDTTGAEVETEGAGADTEEETASADGVDDSEDEEEAADESLFAEQPIMPKGKATMELVKCRSRVSVSDERPGYRAGIEYVFEPDRSEYPDAAQVKKTVWGNFYDDDKPGMKDMNRRAVKQFRDAGLFPDQVILVGKKGGDSKRVKFDHDDVIGGMYDLNLGIEEYQGEKSNNILAIKRA